MSEFMTVAGTGFSTNSRPRKSTDRLTHRYQASATESCQGSHHIELQHGLGDRTTKAPYHEGDSGDEEADTSPKHIREATIQRLEGRAGEQVGCGQPCCVIGRIEVRADRSICRSCDGAVESGEEDICPERCIWSSSDKQAMKQALTYQSRSTRILVTASMSPRAAAP